MAVDDCYMLTEAALLDRVPGQLTHVTAGQFPHLNKVTCQQMHSTSCLKQRDERTLCRI